MSRITNLAGTFLILTILSAHSAALAQKDVSHKGVGADAKIMATPEVTYKALRSMRDEDPGTCKILSANETESVIEEVFEGLPLIGNATCVYRETYAPQKKVEYKMIRSDKLKAFEGAWTLEAVDNGAHTLVHLQSFTDAGLKVPFARQMTDLANSHEVKEQVADLKKSAEQKQKNIAAARKNQAI